MPLPGKRRTATCSATRLCPLRSSLKPHRKVSSRVASISANIVTDDGIFGAGIVMVLREFDKEREFI